MFSELFSSFVAPAFAAMLFILFLKKRSREINGGEANDNGVANDGTAGGASVAHASTECHGAATSLGYDYEVFLSFRGPDTRATFTDYLYNSLKDAGIRTFKDDENLRKGEEFAPKLLQAIEQSKILVPIFSKGYATSVWCLKEVAKMVECKKVGGQKIIPIFYDVAPAEVRNQIGGYKNAFFLHESKKRYDQKTIGEWKAALNAVGEINGCNLLSMPNRREGEFVKTITQKVFNELRKAYLAVSDHFVSVDNHVDAIMEIIGAGTSETRIIGIHGMGGIGKTTVAKIIFNNISQDFEYCCFINNIRETVQNKGIEYLQHWLISETLKVKCERAKDFHEGRQIIKERSFNKKVLLLLDDVEQHDHIYALVGNHDWWGEGSKIIITTRRKNVIMVPEVDGAYELTGMDHNHSLQLFSKHAFRRDSPLYEHIKQSNRAINIAGGLPLALEVIGSLLCSTKMGMWDATLKMLESVPHDYILSKLKISYDALDLRQKLIFLDIACLFIGYKKDILIHFWDESKYFPKVAMDVLENMSLIKIKENNRVWMHDQLRDLGRQIIREESSMSLEKQSRVWELEEGLDLLKGTEIKKDVEALRLKLHYKQQCHFTREGFKNLSGLRFLEVGGTLVEYRIEGRLLWLESPSNVNPTNENSCLLPKLRWLSWHSIPPTFNVAYFSMENVVILDLSGSEITDEWSGWSHMEVMKNLKILDLNYCYCLERTPNFSAHSNLERLIMHGCSGLVEVDGSICQLKSLVFLDLSDCDSLHKLPDELGANLGRLEYLSLEGCPLERLPKTIGDLESLIELDISYTCIKELPDSIGILKNLNAVRMVGVGIKQLPNALWMMENVEEIEINARSHIPHVHVGDCIYRNQSLRILRLMGVGIDGLPPRLPESLIDLQLVALNMHKFPDLSNLTNLTKLELKFFGSRDDDNRPVEHLIPSWMGNLSKLQSLSLSCNFRETISPTDVCLPPRLKSLHLKCLNLRCLPRLPSTLSSLNLCSCDSLCSVGDLSNLKNLSSLHISFTTIVEIQGLGCLENLRDLQLRNLHELEKLPDLSNLNKLTRLEISHCEKLVDIQGEPPRSLDNFQIFDCLCLGECGSKWLIF